MHTCVNYVTLSQNISVSKDIYYYLMTFGPLHAYVSSTIKGDGTHTGNYNIRNVPTVVDCTGCSKLVVIFVKRISQHLVNNLSKLVAHVFTNDSQGHEWLTC